LIFLFFFQKRKHKSAFKGEIILDDRKETLKYKLNDAQLIGFPWVIIIGRLLFSAFSFHFSSNYKKLLFLVNLLRQENMNCISERQKKLDF